MKKFILPIILLALVAGIGLWGFRLYDRYFMFGRMWETPGVRPHEAVLPIMEEGSVPVSGGEAQFRATDGLTLQSPLVPITPSDLEEGRRLYFVFCAQCHGRNYDGRGTVGQSFTPLPADLNHPDVQSLSEGELFKNISYGRPPAGRQPPLAASIGMKDRWKIVAHIQSLGLKAKQP